MAYHQVKCTCCNWRYADYNVKLSGSREISDKYCKECKANHWTSSKYPGKSVEYTGIGHHPRNPSPPLRRANACEYGQCQCCGLFYYNTAVQRVQYECSERGHSFTYCLDCAHHHRDCRHDHSLVTMPSMNEVLEKLVKKDVKYPGPIQPYR